MLLSCSFPVTIEVGTIRSNASQNRMTRQTLQSRLSSATLGDVGHALGELWEGARAVLPYFNTEVKLQDNNIAQAGTAVGVINPLSVLAQGSDYNQRDGNSVRAVSLEFRYDLEVNAAAAFDIMRIIVFIDHEQQGVLPTPAQLLEALDPRSSFQHNGLDRFEVIYDKLHTLSTTGPAALSAVEKMPLGHHVKYTGIGGPLRS